MSEFITAEQEFELRKVEELFLESVETVFQTSISPDLSIEIGEIAQYNPDKFPSVFPAGIVAVKIGHKSDSSALEYIVLSQETTAKLSDLMVMGDGSAEFNADEHLDAIQEIIDQVFGAFSNTPADFIKGGRDYELAEADNGELSIISMIDNSWAAVQFVLKMDEEHIFFHLINQQAIKGYLALDSNKQEVVDDVFADAATKMNKEIKTEPPTAQFQSFGADVKSEGSDFGEIEKLLDLNLQITIELGRTSMFIKDILKLSPGSIIELDKLSGDPVDIYVNDKVFAEGEVVVIDENFGVRITGLVKPEERLRKLS